TNRHTLSDCHLASSDLSQRAYVKPDAAIARSMSVIGTSATSRGDLAKSAHEGQSGRVAVCQQRDFQTSLDSDGFLARRRFDPAAALGLDQRRVVLLCLLHVGDGERADGL